jgi:hypothetical protein
MTDPAPRLDSALRSLIADAGGAEKLVVPRGYPHLGLAIVDAVFSLRANYDSTVVPILRRYCSRAETISWEERFDETVPEHGTPALLQVLGPMSSSDRCELLNRQVAPGTSKRKAEVVVEVALVLAELGIDGHQDLASSVRESKVAERAVLSIAGIGPAAWRYLLNLSRIERSKPDTMVERWIGKVTTTKPSQEEAARALEAAVDALQLEGVDVTVRAIDHLVWRAASGRDLTE